MNWLKAVWVQVWDLLVEDPLLAFGTLIALMATGLWSLLADAHPTVRDAGGWVLLVLVMVVLLTNLYIAGLRAVKKRATP